MKITICTMFPEMFDSFLAGPVLRRAVRKGVLEMEIADIKEFAPGSFRHIDDSPFGGGPGMIMRCQPVVDTLRAVSGRTLKASPNGQPADCAEKDPAADQCRIAALTPAGAVFCQKKARELARLPHLILLCGHYEGMDERIYSYVDEEISIGDYVLTGGEPAAMVVADSVIRLLPDVLRAGSTEDESFENGLLEYPQYTQPAEFEGMRVPEVLLSGDHERIRQWRHRESLRKTMERRPDLLEKLSLSDESLITDY